MKIKYFYSPAIFSNQPKLYILTEDCILYSESRDYSVVQIDRCQVDSFEDFDPKSQESEDYPIFLEIDEMEATKISEDLRPNWMRRYILEKNGGKQQAMQA